MAFLARSGALLGRLLGFMGASDLILGGFGEGLGGIWRGFGEGFAKVLEDFGKIYFDFLHWDPRAVSLRPAERHNTRGFPTPNACWTMATRVFLELEAHMESLNN